jgi:hypothetical protein
MDKSPSFQKRNTEMTLILFYKKQIEYIYLYFELPILKNKKIIFQLKNISSKRYPNNSRKVLEL